MPRTLVPLTQFASDAEQEAMLDLQRILATHMRTMHDILDLLADPEGEEDVAYAVTQMDDCYDTLQDWEATYRNVVSVDLNGILLNPIDNTTFQVEDVVEWQAAYAAVAAKYFQSV